MKTDYELRAAKLRQQAVRAESGWQPPQPVVKFTPPKEPKRKPDLWKIAQAIMGAVGDAVPDGDPIDRLIPFVYQEVTGRVYRDREAWMEGCNVTKWLDKACRAHLHCRSYNRYLIDAWDGWNEVCEPDQQMDNPWKPQRSRS